MASFGESLRREREVRGVSLQEIAASTKIGVSMLKAIEEDRLDKLPQGLFVRGFVREYARSLGLDEQQVMTELSFHAAPLPAFPPPEEESPRRVPSRLATRLVNGALVAGVFGAVAVLILSPRFSARSEIEPGESEAEASSGVSSGGGEEAIRSSTSEAGTLGQAQAAASVLPQPVQLTLTATEDCWIGLDVGGDRVENRILKKGESFSISARQNASLAVGNAGGLLVAIDSGPGRPLGNRGEVKRNIVLSPETISALSADSETVPGEPIG